MESYSHYVTITNKLSTVCNVFDVFGLFYLSNNTPY